MLIKHGRQILMLQSTSLLRGKTRVHCEKNEPESASIHFPLAREDHDYRSSLGGTDCFNPLPSCEGRPCNNHLAAHHSHASIHFPLAREDPNALSKPPQVHASIHFPLAREDRCNNHLRIHSNASIHFPLAREDSFVAFYTEILEMLQSTSLLRGKTESVHLRISAVRLQSTSLLRGKT